MAQKIIERTEARYEWHPAYVILECDCGERLTLTAASTTACGRCGARLGGFVHALQGHEDRLPDILTHPWFYDAHARARRRLRDEAAYPEGSPWRYNDVTADES